MAAATVTLRLTVRQRWWLRWYVLGLWACSQVTGLQPDLDKVGPWIERGIIIKAER